MAAGQAIGCVLRHFKQGGQGLFTHHNVQGLLHQRDLVPLAEPEHNGGEFSHRPAVPSSQGTGHEDPAVRTGIQNRSGWRRPVHVLGNGQLCEARGKPPDEHYLEVGRAYPSEVSEKNK